MCKMFWYYTIPHFINKYIRHIEATPKAYEVVKYCCKVIRGERPEPQTFQEQLFEEEFLQAENFSREEVARMVLVELVPYCNLKKENDKNVSKEKEDNERKTVF